MSFSSKLVIVFKAAALQWQQLSPADPGLLLETFFFINQQNVGCKFKKNEKPAAGAAHQFFPQVAQAVPEAPVEIPHPAVRSHGVFHVNVSG